MYPDFFIGLLKSRPNFGDFIRGAYSGVNSVQREIFYSLLMLKSINGLDRVYSEGFSEDYDSDSSRAALSYNLCRLRNHLGLIDCVDGAVGDYAFVPGAVILLGADHGVVLKSSESSILHSICYDLSRKGVGDGEFRKMYGRASELREDYVLQLLASDSSQISVLVFGGVHDFSDNVRDYNSLNPDGKFSLLVATPRSYSCSK